MWKYILRRIAMVIPVLLGVTIIIFLVMHFTPGDPAHIILGEKASAQMIKQLREQMGLNDPLYVQYLRFMKNLIFHGDLGKSWYTKDDVTLEIMARFPATLELTLTAMLIATFGGVLLGIASAYKKDTIVDNVSMFIALFGVSMPIFWLALMLILIFSVRLDILPVSGRIDLAIFLDKKTNLFVLDSIITGNLPALKDSIMHLILPSIALATIPLAVIARMTRSSMLDVMRQDYIRTARSKGLMEKVVIYRHALKNALIPVVTVIGLEVGLLLGGAILTETVFAWPGVGRLAIQGITYRDIPIVQGTTLFFSGIFVVVNLIVDVTYAYLDPRIHYR
jgi:peptide/nickel transport system permease protein